MKQRDSRTRSTLIVGTRGSQLAIWQAEWVQRQLKALAPNISVILKRIQTSGDKIQDVPLAKIGGKGLFVKEIEEALLRRDIDLAVHSMKDVPSELPEGLEIVCVPEREDPRDALIAREGHTLATLPVGARVGTSSLRRQAQLLHVRPDLEIAMLRGNVGTRLRKVREGHFDAIILAASGLKRLGWEQEVTEYLSVDVSLPAIGQGSLGMEGRKDDTLVRELVAQFEHRPTRIAVTAERALLAGLEGGCQVPIAGYATLQGDTLTLDGLVASLDGKRYIRQVVSGPAEEAECIGTRVAEQLLDGGAQPILQEIYGMA
ncbi:MAG: hydroxymethylbilane synthase [Nitrospirae bacterium CG_4_9_14_3_um_filter_51_5]|nr:MAG: hydroxymethylbilane synthase [Nitrospirae bacterium CG_4_9_14_3_um_filter_51_5]